MLDFFIVKQIYYKTNLDTMENDTYYEAVEKHTKLFYFVTYYNKSQLVTLINVFLARIMLNFI
jgi:hypothetical protein